MPQTRRFRALCAASATVLVALAVWTARAGAQQTNRDMMYFVLGEKYPPGLHDFQAFGLFREWNGRRTRWSGWVMTDRDDPNGSTATMASVKVNGPRLTFTSKPRRGVGFTFTGRFLRQGDFSAYRGKDVPVVEGTVRELRRGRPVATGRMRFCCGSGG